VTPQDPGITTDPEPPTDDLESDDEDFATKVDRFEEELELLPDETLEPLEMAAADDVTAIMNDDDLLAMSGGPDLDPENPATQTSKTDAEPEADPDLFEDVGTDLTTLDGGGSENKD